ncbi:MAG: methylamine utilization protein [Burkholderiaceae bacterium]
MTDKSKNTEFDQSGAKQGVSPARRLVIGAGAIAAIDGLASTGSLFAKSGGRSAHVSFEVFGSKNNPIENAVVSLTSLDEVQSPAAPGVIEVVQQNKQFAPYVSAVGVGSSVSFPNLDDVKHHVYSFSKAKPFELKLLGKERPDLVVLDRAGTIVVGCNIHDRMVGFIRVVKSPHYGVTDAAGQWTGLVPPGRYGVDLWHPTLDIEQARLVGTIVVGRSDAKHRYTLPIG